MKNEALRICLLNDSFPPVIDGVANAVVNYAELLTRGGDAVTVATPYYPGAADDYPFSVIRYPSIDFTKQFGYRAGFPFDPASLVRLRESRPQIIHSHCPVTSTLLARELREAAGAPVVFTYHTKFDIDIARAVESRLLQKAAIHALCANIRACDEVWVVSRGAGENLRSLGYDGEYIVMENGVDFPRGRVQEAEATALRRELGAEGNEPLFLFVGRMMWYKGLKIILDGLKTAGESGCRFRMAFVGDGSDRKEIETYAHSIGLQDDCVFTGAVHDRERLRGYFCAADLFLFPSSFDTNGIVVREAAACELPSVLIRGSCAAEGVTDGHNGLLIEENAAAMGETIRRVCAGTLPLREIGANAQAELYISWEESVSRARARYSVILERFSGSAARRRLMYGSLAPLGELHEALEKMRRSGQTHIDRLRQWSDRYQ